MLITSTLSLLLMTIVVSHGSIFCGLKVKSSLLSNFFMPMFRPNFLPKLKFFALTMGGSTHLIYSKNSCKQMVFYLKGHVLQLHSKMVWLKEEIVIFLMLFVL